jgi:hypothetical protein
MFSGPLIFKSTNIAVQGILIDLKTPEIDQLEFHIWAIQAAKIFRCAAALYTLYDA